MEVKKRPYIAACAIVVVLGAGAVAWLLGSDAAKQGRYERNEMEVLVSNPGWVKIRLFRTGNDIRAAGEMRAFTGGRISLGSGNYFIRAEHPVGPSFYPVPALGYNAGPERDGSLLIAVRTPPERRPPVLEGAPAFVFIPSGHFLIGDRASPRGLHYAWVTGFFMSPFETTNAEFRQFLNEGYANDAYGPARAGAGRLRLAR